MKTKIPSDGDRLWKTFENQENWLKANKRMRNMLLS